MSLSCSPSSSPSCSACRGRSRSSPSPSSPSSSSPPSSSADARSRQLPPPARRHRPHQLLHPGVRLRHVRRAALQPRAARLRRLLRRQPRKQAAWTDAIFAYALYYPVVEFLSSVAIALVLWRGRLSAIHHGTTGPRTPPGIEAPGIFFGTVTVGVLIAFIQYAQRFFRPIMDLSDKYNILQAAMAAAERVFKLLDTSPPITSPRIPHRPRRRRPRLRPHRVPQRLVHLPAHSPPGPSLQHKRPRCSKHPLPPPPRIWD